LSLISVVVLAQLKAKAKAKVSINFKGVSEEKLLEVISELKTERHKIEQNEYTSIGQSVK
jgi:phosphotransferase system HPr-like phosphotransfer protein